MIFRPEMVAKILAGEKTKTRRPAHGSDALECRYQLGIDYAVQPGRGQHAVARILVTSLGRQKLGAIRNADARREGFADRAAFLSYWLALYGSVDLALPVWVIGFEVVRDA